jgi:hypothetical protein
MRAGRASRKQLQIQKLFAVCMPSGEPPGVHHMHVGFDRLAELTSDESKYKAAAHRR